MTDGKLLSGQRLAPETTLVSVGGQARLHYQGDGNLVVYIEGVPFWASHTDGVSAGHLKMRRDGNLVVSDADGNGVASTGTQGHPGAMVQLQDDGNFVLYEDPKGPLAGTPIWASSTGAFTVGGVDPVVEARAQHPDPLLGLHIANGTYVDGDDKPRLPVGVHLGDLIGQGLVLGIDRILPTLDQVAELGYHFVRSWFVLPASPSNPFWGHRPAPRWNPLDNRELFFQILQAGADRGLTWHLAAGGLDSLGNDTENRLFDLVAEAMDRVGPQYFSLIEACNEVRDTGDDDDKEPAELERLVQRVRSRHPNNLYSLSAYTGTEDRDILNAFTPSWAQHYYLHGYRGGRAHDKIRHLYSIGAESPVVRKLGWQGELFGPGRIVSAMDNQHELTDEVMQMVACQAAMCRQAYAFMSGPGVILFDEPLDQMAGFSTTPAIVRRLPQDLMQFGILGHSGPRFAGTRIHAASGEVRADYAIHHDGRYVEVVYGPPEQAKNLRQERQTKDVQRLVDCPWGYVEIGQLR